MSAESSPSPSPATASALFRDRAFVLFVGGRTLSVLATQMKNVAIGWQVYALSHDPFDLGLVGLVQFAAAITSGLAAGSALDAFERRRIWQICQGVKLLCYAWLLGLTLSGAASLPLILVAVAGLGLVQGFELPAGQAMLPLVVERVALPKAIATQSSVIEAVTILGPALGGFLIAIDLWVGYVACALVMLATGACAGLLRPRFSQTRDPGGGGTLARILGGLTFLRSRPEIWGAITLDMMAVLLGGLISLLPVFAHDILHVGAEGLGVLRTAISVGALATAAALARWPIRRHGGRVMLGAVAAFGVATILFSLSTSFWLSCLALMALGVADEISVFTRANLIQLATPDDVRGRVAAVNAIFITTSNQLGEFESGLTAAWFGVVPAALLGGVGTILVAGLWAWMFPGLRRVDDLTRFR